MSPWTAPPPTELKLCPGFGAAAYTIPKIESEMAPNKKMLNIMLPEDMIRFFFIQVLFSF